MKKYTNTFKRLLAGFLILIICLTGTAYMDTTRSQAATASITIALSASSIQKGGSVTATVKVSCSDAIGAVSFCLSYDSSVLEYSSGSGSGGGGTVRYAGYGDGSSTSISASFTFSAISTGTASLSTGSTEVYAWDESYCSVSDAGCSVTVTAASGAATTEAPASGDTTTEASASNDNTEASTTEAPTTEATTETYSDNCYLASLEITPGTYEPAFSRDQYTYTATVPSDTESLAINAIPEDDTALVSIDGNSDFVAGEVNKITITVTAETGDQKIYYLNVTPEEAEDTRVYVTLNGVEYFFAQDYNHFMIPEGFSQTTGSYQGNEITMFTSPNGAVNCVCLTNDDNNENWFIYDETDESFIPFIEATASYNRYLILTPGADVAIPDGYTEFTYTFDGTDISAYHRSDSDEIILIYAMNVEGEAGFYRYDTIENTFLRYISDLEITEADTATASDASADETFLDKYKNMIAIIAIIVSLILLIIIICLIVVLAKISKKHGDTDDTDDTADTEDDADNEMHNDANDPDDSAEPAGTDGIIVSSVPVEAVPSESVSDDTPSSSDVDTLIDSAFSGIQFTPHVSSNSKPRMSAVPVAPSSTEDPASDEPTEEPVTEEPATEPAADEQSSESANVETTTDSPADDAEDDE